MAVLGARQYRFVQEYCKDFNGTRAAESAGYSPKSAYSIASELLKKPEIQAAIEDEKSAAAALARVSVGFVIRELMAVATSDRRVCCRHCYGIDHKYQWAEREYEKALCAALEDGGAAPEFRGGLGYTKLREPFSECPECQGNGIVKSDDPVRPSDKIKALDIISRYLGMIVERKELSGPGGGPVPLATLNVNELTDAQLAALCAGGNVIDGGTIGGTLELTASNPASINELEAVSSP